MNEGIREEEGGLGETDRGMEDGWGRETEGGRRVGERYRGREEGLGKRDRRRRGKEGWVRDRGREGR